MAVNPLVAYTDLVAGSPAGDPVDTIGSAPVGILNEDPFDAQPASPALQAELQAVAIPNDDGTDSGGGNFNDDAELDPSQVVAAPSMGVPLSLPGVPGYSAPPAELQTEGWFQQLADSIDAMGNVREKLGDMFSPSGAEIPMGAREADTIGLPRTSSATPQTPQGLMTPGATQVAPENTERGDSNYVTDDPAMQRKIVGLAQSFIGAGTPYQFGGNTLGGASREGMIQAAYAAAGVQDMPAFAGSLTRRGDEIAPDDLKPGDLVSWSGSRKNPFGDDQLGIFMGNRQVISASQKRGFHMLSMDKLEGQVKGYRVRKSNGGVSFAASESSAGAAQAAAEATVKAINNIFGNKSEQKKKKDDDKKSGGNKGGGKPSGQGSKYYGSDQNNTNNSSKHYTGIGATK